MKSIIEVIVYKTKSGKEPYVEWEQGLDKTDRAVIQSRLTRIRRGNFGDISTIKGGRGVYEIRLDFGPGYRIYFGKIGTEIVLLLVGGIKRSQSRDIEKANQYWRDYEESHEKKI